MQIAQARTQADKHLANNMIESRAKRPPVGAAVMTRFPKQGGTLITAGDEEELREKVAKRIQARARRMN